MIIKKFVLSLLILSLLSGSVISFAAPVGSSGDPLISQSYIDNTYPSIVLKDPFQMIKDSVAVLEYKLRSAISGANISSIPAGGGITLVSGSSFTFISGQGSVSRLNGILIDVTEGVSVSSGSALKANHRYVAGGSTLSYISISSPSKASVVGNSVVLNSGMLFTDTPAGQWYHQYVLYAYSKGLINGKTSSLFAPSDNLTVAEAIKLASCIHQLYETGSVTLEGGGGVSWYVPYLEYAQKKGIATKTYSDYNQIISREEFVNIFFNALPESSYKTINTVANDSIPDVKSSSNYSKQIYAFYRAGILNGSDSQGTFSPASNIKRSEVSAIVTRMLEEDLRVSITLQ